MSYKEYQLGEIETTYVQARSALQCLVHTLLFLRAPGLICPREAQCDHFNMSYANCQGFEDNIMVEKSIDAFLHSLPKAEAADKKMIRGCLTVSFYERRKTKAYLILSSEEHVVFEMWMLPICIRPAASTNLFAGQQEAESKLRRQMHKMFEIVNGQVDHIPKVIYYFKISSTQRNDNKRESLSSRSFHTPSFSLA